jgi:ribosomal protein S18 acetylase RimI-like enzyme
MHITTATEDDIPVLVSLMNAAYRGDSSKQGWTTEADMVAGDLRSDEKNIRELMQMAGTAFLKYCNEKNETEGCVFLQKREGKLYLGMLSVSPALQAKGIGKKLMTAAEQYAIDRSCPAIFMRVISIRHELIAWYERQGYYNTGQIQPFEDTKFGLAKMPIEFIVLEKEIMNNH